MSLIAITKSWFSLKADAKWYKLLGGPATTYKTPPGLLLRLHLEAMTLDQQSGVRTLFVSYKKNQYFATNFVASLS